MNSDAADSIDAILADWVGPLDEEGRALPEKVTRWWSKEASFDAYLRQTYGGLIEQAIGGELLPWEQSARGKLALILLVDQMARNVHRGTARMYAGDARAVRLARGLLDSGALDELEPMHRYFVFMPFMHSEALEDQRRCEALFTDAAGALGEALRPLFAAGAEYATKHRVIVERFSRFPHRNDILARRSTDEEVEFLKQPGSSF